MQVIPAILTNSKDEFITQFKALVSHYQYFQIDVADGLFVPNLTLSIAEILEILRSLQSITANVTFDFHLMVKDCPEAVKQLSKLDFSLKIKNVFIHSAAIKSPIEFYQLSTEAVKYFTLCLVINPDEDINTIIHIYDLKLAHSILIMTVQPGFQGSSFIPKTMEKVEQLKSSNYRLKIFIDGSINDQTIPVILSKNYKPDFLCVGSFLTKTDKLSEHIEYLKSVTNEK